MKIIILGMLLDTKLSKKELEIKIIARIENPFTSENDDFDEEIKKLISDGFITVNEDEIVTISRQGEREFIRLLRGKFFEKRCVIFPIDESILFSDKLERTKVIDYIDTHISDLNHVISFLENKIEDYKSLNKNYFSAPLIVEHTLEHMFAERCWLEKVKDYCCNK